MAFKIPSGLNPVLRREPRTFQLISRTFSHCPIEAGLTFVGCLLVMREEGVQALHLPCTPLKTLCGNRYGVANPVPTSSMSGNIANELHSSLKFAYCLTVGIRRTRCRRSSSLHPSVPQQTGSRHVDTLLGNVIHLRLLTSCTDERDAGYLCGLRNIPDGYIFGQHLYLQNNVIQVNILLDSACTFKIMSFQLIYFWTALLPAK